MNQNNQIIYGLNKTKKETYSTNQYSNKSNNLQI